MMTIEEAIWKEEALAYSFGERYKRLGEPVGDLPELEAEHKQYAEWLRELRELRRNRIGRFSVGCATCIHMKTDDYTKRPCDICCYNYFSKYESEVNADANSVGLVCDIFDEMNRDEQIKVWQYVNEIMEGE